MRLPRNLKGLPRSFWVLWTGTLINRLGMVVEPFLALYLTVVRHLPIFHVGIVLTGYGCGSFVSYLLGGWLADRVGRRNTLVIGTLAAAATFCALAYVQSLPAIGVTAFFVGATIDIYRPASAAAVADIVAPDDRPRAYGLLYWAINLGFAVATVGGGLIAHRDFFLLFGMNALTSVAFAGVMWRALPDTRASNESESRSYAAVLRDWTMVGYTLVTLAFTMIYIQATTTLPLTMHAHGMSASDYGFAIGINGVAVLVLQPLVVGWLAKRDHSRVLATGLTLAGLGFGVVAFCHVLWQFIASVLLWTMGEILVMTVAQTIVAELAPATMRGQYNGFNGLAWAVGNLLAPLAGTWLLSETGSGLWLGCLCAGLAGAAGQLLLRPAIRRRSCRRHERAATSAEVQVT